MSFESMESPMLEIQNLRNAFTEHRQTIAEQDAEIERLKAEIKRNDEIWKDHNEKILKQRLYFKDLVARAADALYEWPRTRHDEQWIWPFETHAKLIDELRKAAGEERFAAGSNAKGEQHESR
jgi:hypothetical protein